MDFFECFLLQYDHKQNNNYMIHLQNCSTGTNKRRRRGITDNQGTTVSDMATVTSGPITTRLDGEDINIFIYGHHRSNKDLV